MYKYIARFTTVNNCVITITDRIESTTVFGALSAIQNRITGKYPDAVMREMKIEPVNESKVNQNEQATNEGN